MQSAPDSLPDNIGRRLNVQAPAALATNARDQAASRRGLAASEARNECRTPNWLGRLNVCQFWVRIPLVGCWRFRLI
jgi:hypothetical protein